MKSQALSPAPDAPAPGVASHMPSLARLLTEKEAAKILGTSTQYLVKWRFRGQPVVQFIQIGRMIRYRQADLDAFVAARVVAGYPKGGNRHD